MPAVLPHNLIQDAKDAVEHAQLVRRYHARKRGGNHVQRATDIEIALDRLRAAMKPLRSEIGRFSYGPQTSIAEENRNKIREASAAIQVERRKLWKLRKATRPGL